MSGFLRQATASQSRAIGPFIDDTDFKTPETGLTIANTDIKLVANGAASANKNSGGGTHRVNGVYGVTFDATDSATVGELEVSVVVSGALPVFDKWTVLEETVYDALFAASAPGYLQSTTAGRTLDVSAAGNAGIDWSNVEAPTTTLNLSGTSTLALEPTTAGRKLDVTTGGEAGIDWSNIGAPTTTVNLSGTTVKAVTDAVSATIGTGGITSASFAAGAIDAAAIATDAIGANEVSAAAVTKIQTGLATPTNITAGTITTVTNLTNAATSGDLTATMKASVNTEVVDGLNVDTYAEPSGVPAATASIQAKVSRVYQALRNELTVTSSALTFKSDAGSDLWKKPLADDGTIYTESEGTTP